MKQPLTAAFGEVWDWPDLAESEYQAPEWYIDQLVPADGKVLITGAQEVGKSALGQQLALSLTTGREFLGLSIPQPRPVVYIQSEGDLGDSAQRGRAMLPLTGDPSPGMLTWAFYLKHPINRVKGRQALHDVCEQYALHEGLIIIDPVYKTFRGSLNDDEAVGEWQSNLDAVAQEFKSAVLALHHEHRAPRDLYGKKVAEEGGDRAYGSAFWHAWASYGFTMAKHREPKRFALVNWKRRRPTRLSEAPTELTMVEPWPFGFELFEEGLTSTAATIRALTKTTGKEYNREELQSLLGSDGKDRSKTAVQEAVATLEEQGFLVEVGGSRPQRFKYQGRES